MIRRTGSSSAASTRAWPDSPFRLSRLRATAEALLAHLCRGRDRGRSAAHPRDDQRVVALDLYGYRLLALLGGHAELRAPPAQAGFEDRPGALHAVRRGAPFGGRESCPLLHRRRG